MQLLRNKNFFLNFLLYFWDLHQVLKSLETRMTLIAYVFLKLKTVKDVIK